MTKLFPCFLVFYEVIVYLSNDMYLPALPQLMLDLNISADLAQLTLNRLFFWNRIFAADIRSSFGSIWTKTYITVGWGRVYYFHCGLCYHHGYYYAFNCTVYTRQHGLFRYSGRFMPLFMKFMVLHERSYSFPDG